MTDIDKLRELLSKSGDLPIGAMAQMASYSVTILKEYDKLKADNVQTDNTAVIQKLEVENEKFKKQLLWLDEQLNRGDNELNGDEWEEMLLDLPEDYWEEGVKNGLYISYDEIFGSGTFYVKTELLKG